VTLTLNTVAIGNCLSILREVPDGTFQCCVTSPPYWGLRDYGHPDQIGLEPTVQEYVEKLVAVFREVRRVLRPDGTLWLNLGDCYFGGGYSNHDINGPSWKAEMNGDKRRSRQRDTIRNNPGLKPKDLVGVPWSVAFALRDDGWWLRSDVIWVKSNCMPEPVEDRPTKAHEYVFLLSASHEYTYDAKAISEPVLSASISRYEYQFGGSKSARLTAAGTRTHPIGTRFSSGRRNVRTVWELPVSSSSIAHFATMPPALATRCILAGSRIGDAVLDPFMGSGTTAMVAESLGRTWWGCELNSDYGEIIRKRTRQTGLPFTLEANTAGERACSRVESIANAPSPLVASSEPASPEGEGVAGEGDQTEGSSTHE
jgi:DNA modification methylase